MKPLARTDLPRGFRFASIACGLKPKGALDLALFVSETPAQAALVLTRNRVRAAPLKVSREHVSRAASRMRAIVVNAGNANCCTGPEGLATARATASAVARAIGVAREQVLVASTGVIGVPLPRGTILSAIPALVRSTVGTPAAAQAAARAIMTTDTRPKTAFARCTLGGHEIRVFGVAKGAGMIHPNMATMLAFVFTDATISAGTLRRAVRHSVDRSFNRISVDGDTSTNDMVAVLANGAAQNPIIRDDSRDAIVFRHALAKVLLSLAEQIVRDGEGARRLVRVIVSGAQDDTSAGRIANTIATSLLVKTALAGGDPNWGRILAAAGRAGVAFDPERVDVRLAGTLVCRRGQAVPFNEAVLSRRMSVPKVTIEVGLHQGRARCEVLTCDLTEAYVRINASYRT